MRFSGKKTVILMFAIAIGLCTWVRIKAPNPNKKTNVEESGKPKQKPQRGYRSKVYPTMEQARNTAEKKLMQLFPDKKIITQYKSSGDGWIFFYENEKYLNFAKPEDKAKDNTPIFVSKDGTADFYVEDKKSEHR